MNPKRFVFIKKKKSSIKYEFSISYYVMPAVTCEPALSNVGINFYQLNILVRQDMTNATEYFVPNIVKK